MAERDPLDPKGLIREAYRMEGLGPAECRSIFLDWALSLGDGEAETALPLLLERFGAVAPAHPMTAVLTEGLTPPRPVGARGRPGRRRDRA